MEKINDKIRYHQLYDIYQGLLTDKQKTYFEYYYLDDYSLSEIADLLKVSRNAVHEQLKNVVSHLEHYEETLMILDKKEKREKLIQELEKHFHDEASTELLHEMEKLEV